MDDLYDEVENELEEEELSESPTDDTEDDDADPATEVTGVDTEAESSEDDEADPKTRAGLLKVIRELREDRRELRSAIQELKDRDTRKPADKDEEDDYYSPKERELDQKVQRMERIINGEMAQRVKAAEAEFDTTLETLNPDVLLDDEARTALMNAAANIRERNPKLSVAEVTKRAYTAYYGEPARKETKETRPAPNPKKATLVRPGGAAPRGKPVEDFDDVRSALRSSFRELSEKSK